MSIKVLLTTVYKRTKWDYYDYFKTNASTLWRPFQFRTISYGLRFLKQNIPEIEILEYPTWEEYVNKLKEGWDVVGFSFYLNEITEILQMAQEARKQGIKELWAGNYGALTEGIESYFDRIFIGYAEHQVAEVFGRKIDEIIHPPIIQFLRITPLFIYRKLGILFTQRACNHSCSFCQTPVFQRRPYKISLESIERVIKFYAENNIRHVLILDENFGMYPIHSRKVYEILGKYRIYSTTMLRADTLIKDIKFYVDNGFEAGFIGVETVSPKTMEEIGKRETPDAVKEAAELMHRYNIYITGYYMLGFENDTVESLLEDIEVVRELKLDFNQVTVVTPLPRTPLWYDLDKKYGIFEKDWRKYDVKHLVWNHPYITPQQMRRLLSIAFKRLNPPERLYQAIKKLSKRYMEYEKGTSKAIKHLLEQPIYGNLQYIKDKRPYVFF